VSLQTYWVIVIIPAVESRCVPTKQNFVLCNKVLKIEQMSEISWFNLKVFN